MIDQIKHIIAKNRFLYYISCIAFCISGFITSALFLVMRIFPIQNNKIVCCNMKGKRYGDNPKYIADEIIRRGLDYEIVWLMKDEYDVDLPKEIRRAKYNAFSCAYELATAKFWIDSNSKQMGTIKRKNQFYIQTWHGSYGMKKIFSDIPNKMSFIDRQNLKTNCKTQDLMISNSNFTTQIYRRAIGYRGKILECGSPRNDIFFESKEIYIQKVQKFFHLKNKNIVLYAPTYRDDFCTDNMHLDFERLLQNLSCRFSGKWVVLVRLHPYNMTEAESFIHYSDTIINATEYSVMQELLVASDILISDYSSCIFDFVTKGKVCFLYATDVRKYKSERDMYFDIYKLPFPLAENNDELEGNILTFDENIYQERLKKLFAEVGLCDNGNASRETVDWILSQNICR